MKQILIAILIFITFHLTAQNDTVFINFPQSNTFYIDKNLPDTSPIEYLSNFIDFEKHHIHSAPMFTPDMNEMYFSLYLNNDFPQRIFFTKRKNGIWTKPELASFSGTYQEGGPVISPDGNRIYYYSKRPKSGKTQAKRNIIWFVDRNHNGTWTNPDYIRLNYNDSNIYLPISQTKDSMLIFATGINGQHPWEIYAGKVDENKLINVTKLGAPYFSEEIYASTIHISSDNSKIFYWKIDMNASPKRSTYISKFVNNEWTKPKKTKPSFNTGGSRFPSISPDGKYVFFLSYRSGVERWYWIKSENIF